jgi:DNA-binding SARP family transcriptional activator
LPDWSDDWIMLERERWDQLRLHALEALAQRLITAERYLPALEAALTAVAIEPVRESAHRTVIEVHIAEGNSACAIKHYQRYRGILQRELGVSPSQRMDRLVRALGSASVTQSGCSWLRPPAVEVGADRGLEPLGG